MRNSWVGFLIVVAVAIVPPNYVDAQTTQPTTTYIILAHAQGPGSTNFAPAMGRAVVANYPEIGVVVAESSDPNFPSWATLVAGVDQVAADVEYRLSPTRAGADLVQAGGATAAAFVANSGFRFPLQWNLQQIHADQTAAAGYSGWNRITGVRARVAVLDSGIIKDNPDIAPNLNVGCSASFVPGEPDLEPPAYTESHGTAVAAMVAGAGIEVQGVAPEAEIVAVKVLSAQDTTGKYSWILKGLHYATTNDPARCHPDIINMSIGGQGDTFVRRDAGNPRFGTLVAALNRAISYARRQGILVVSCAGNDGVDLNSTYWILPAQSANGMAVSATGPYGWADSTSPLYGIFDRPASYTNYGQSVINVAAPGGDFVYPAGHSCTVGQFTRDCSLLDSIIAPYDYEESGGSRTYRYAYWYGTSMAAPHVAGLAALLVGKYGHIGPAKLQTIIENSADDVFKPGADAYSGRGRINAAKAVLP